ncbi:hypothetical protein ES703_104496 [subsurface metagenome]
MRNKTFRRILYPIIDIIRALPPLVLILFMYYLLTRQVIGTTIQAYWVCAIAMSLNLAAFTSDLVRAAIENAPRDSIDAGRALIISIIGYSIRRNVLFLIIKPRIIPKIVPKIITIRVSEMVVTVPERKACQ